MLTTSLTLASLVDRTMLDVQSPAEVAKSVVLSTGATTAVLTDNSITLLSATNVNPSDLLEFGSEMMLVTAVTADPIPVITVQRGYYNTVLATHAAATVGYVNPAFPRFRVAEAVRRSFARIEAMGVPCVTSAVLNTAGESNLDLPSECRQVYSVRYLEPESGHFFDLDRWRFQDDLPTTVYPTGKVLSVGWYVSSSDDLVVTYRTPYRWSTYPADPTETATITIAEGAEDLPAIYAAAWLASRREISRTQLARSQEWSESEPIRNGVSLSLIRTLWQQFYQDLDSAKRLYQPPVNRPYKRMARL